MTIKDTGEKNTVKNKGYENSCITSFWNDILEWIDNSIADVIQPYLEYDVRSTIRKAIISAEKKHDDICVIAQVYYLRDFSADHYEKVTLQMTVSTDEFNDEIIETISEHGILTREVEY